MLSPEEIAEIEHEMGIFPIKQAACIEALKVVQKHRRYVSDEALQDIAALLAMSPTELDSVATFYNLIYRRPVGRHVILLCDSVSCWIIGYEKIRDVLKERLGIDYGQTTEDDRFTLLPMCCLGACDKAPVMMIDRDTHDNLTPEKLDDILGRYE